MSTKKKKKVRNKKYVPKEMEVAPVGTKPTGMIHSQGPNVNSRMVKPVMQKNSGRKR